MCALSDYQRLIERHRQPDQESTRDSDAEKELDALVNLLQERQREERGEPPSDKPDPIQQLRERTINELIPVFVELKEKYDPSGVSMEMDVSSFLGGGREIRFEFGVGGYRSHLLGTVTTEAIAFHETRYAPDIQGELVSGPMLRLRHLDAKVFREFVCERLAVLLRTAVRHR